MKPHDDPFLALDPIPEKVAALVTGGARGPHVRGCLRSWPPARVGAANGRPRPGQNVGVTMAYLIAALILIIWCAVMLAMTTAPYVAGEGEGWSECYPDQRVELPAPLGRR